MKHFFLLHFLINSNNELPQQSRFLLWLRMRPNAASPRSLKVPTNNKSVGHQKAQLYVYLYHFRDISSHLFLGPYDLNSTLNVDYFNWTLTTFFDCFTFLKKGKHASFSDKARFNPIPHLYVQVHQMGNSLGDIQAMII